jgi:metal-responsive CopG/Arc/MetJ family transcriptional regulator
MSDMASQRITVRIPTALARQLKKLASLKGRPESELVRKALQDYLGRRTPIRSAYEIAKEAGLIACVKGTPRDLSTNPKYFEGFGKNR